MKLLVQPVKGDPFEVDTNPNDDMTTLKKTIASARMELPAERLKIIHGGKVIDNDQCTVEMLGIVPDDFVVVMVTKSSMPRGAVSDASLTAPATAPTQTASASQQPAQQAPECASTSNASGTATDLTSGETGLPPDAAQNGGSREIDDVFDQLRASPQIATLAQMVSGSPALIDPIVQALQTQHPVLAAAIDSNRERFLELLAEQNNGSSKDSSNTEIDEQNNCSSKDGSNTEMDLNGVLLTQEDEEAADRLVGLGFTAETAVKAFVRCERNEAAAASFLFKELSHSSEPRNAQLALAASEWWRQQQAGKIESPQDALQELCEDPMFEHLARFLADNPDKLAHMVSALEHVHPDIAQAIADNPDQFMRMVRDFLQRAPVVTQDAPASRKHFPPKEEVQMSCEDKEAVARLCNLGFSPEAATQVFLLCSKNEIIAAQALLDMREAHVEIAHRAHGNVQAVSDHEHVQLSIEEEAAVARLVDSGFDRELARHVFVSIGRNEELAASSLHQE